MLCPICGEYMDESLDDGGVDYADEITVVYHCPACDYQEEAGWKYSDIDADEYPVIEALPPDTPAEALAPDEPSDDIPF